MGSSRDGTHSSSPETRSGCRAGEVRDVARHLRRDMGRPQSEVIPQRDQTFGQSRLLAHGVAPVSRVPPGCGYPGWLPSGRSPVESRCISLGGGSSVSPTVVAIVLLSLRVFGSGCGIGRRREAARRDRTGEHDDGEDEPDALRKSLVASDPAFAWRARSSGNDHPAHASAQTADLAASLGPDDDALTAALARVREAAWPEDIGPVP